MQQSRRSVGSPSVSSGANHGEQRTAKSTKTLSVIKGIAVRTPEIPLCPLCSSDDVRHQNGKQYPYYCWTCQTAFTAADIAAKRQHGRAQYRKLCGVRGMA